MLNLLLPVPFFTGHHFIPLIHNLLLTHVLVHLPVFFQTHLRGKFIVEHERRKRRHRVIHRMQWRLLGKGALRIVLSFQEIQLGAAPRLKGMVRCDVVE